MEITLLNPFDYIYKGEDYYRSIKDQCNTPVIKEQWQNKFQGKNWIGHCTRLFRKYKPVSCQDFFEKYTHDEGDYGEKYHGRTLSSIAEIAAEMKMACNDTEHNIEFFMDLIVMHAIIETFDGCQREVEVENELKKQGYTIYDPFEDKKNIGYEEFDSLMGLDVIAYKTVDGVKKYLYFQIKPVSAFMSDGDGKTGMLADRKRFIEADRTLNDFLMNLNKVAGTDFTEGSHAYLVYNGRNGGWFFNPSSVASEKKSHVFYIGDLLNPDGSLNPVWKEYVKGNGKNEVSENLSL